MAELCYSMDTVVKLEENGERDSEEYERLPLKQRLKLLSANKRLLESSGTAPVAESSIDTSVKKEDEQCDSQNLHLAYSVQQEMIGSLALQQNITGDVQHFPQTEAKMNAHQNNMNLSAVPAEIVDTPENTSLQQSLSPKFPVNLKVESVANSMVNSSSYLVNDQSGADMEAIKSKKPDDFLDELDFVVLKERKRILLSRKELCLKVSILEHSPGRGTKGGKDDKPSNFSSILMGDSISQSDGIVKGKLCPEMIGPNKFHRISNSSSAATGGLSSADPQVSELGHQWQTDQSSDRGNSMEVLGNGRRTISKQEDSSHGLDFSSFSRKRKVDSLLSDLLHVKVEPVDNRMVETAVKNSMGTMPHSSSMVLVKSEVGTANDSSGDELDHMLLRERMKLFSPRGVPSFKIGRVAECSSKITSSVSDCTPISSVSAEPLRVSRPRKRRKTATDSVEVAMEEDAPGLLKVLLEKGISVDEIKLYGENESNEPLNDLSSESFSELEAVISKLFSQRQSLLKLAPLQCTKGEKASYCLACLFSLVEQARYLHFRKWPVEWGWCRDLQSFIFVFERHNRIVLERPEYGYATYFFELVDSSPVEWQIRRLVTAMKLTSCGRVTLIENRTLTVGEELSEGEAKVLMAYGWLPNTGLGTMLNYCDRVFHDRKQEKDTSEWRSKIGKLLMDGYNGGSLVGKLMEYNVAQNCPEIKLELD